MANDVEVELLGLQKVSCLQNDLEEKLAATLCEREKEKAVIGHIVKLSSDESVKVEEFGLDLQWINTARPLSLKEDLKGRIVVLDFFTYCCINCMHILPDLHYLEKIIPVEEGLVVVGVHSAKFNNERNLENVIGAVKRYGIQHPVMNDPQAMLWNRLQVQCWPTLVILGPSGHMIFTLSGEGHREQLLFYCKTAVEYFSKEGKILKNEIPTSYLTVSMPSQSGLLFPGKICIDSSSERIIISDSGHHRIVVVNKEGNLLHIIGGDTSGFKDGNFSAAKFHSPQGVTWKDPELIFVADTENHAIREINLVKKIVRTICGTGQLGKDKVGGNVGMSQSINSPWDLCLGFSDDGVQKDILFIAMAGIHQIWMLALEDSKIFNESVPKGKCMSIAGSGNEENRNNRYRRKAGFAQPSGITWAEIGNEKCLFIADSESSTVRCLGLTDGSIKPCVGGERDPLNLFAYGDKDGTGINAKLQHPLGVAWSSKKQMLYVADSYNHKIKAIKPLEKSCVTLSIPEMNLLEPGGLCVAEDDETLYIADTNNHTVKVVDLKMMKFTELCIMGEGNSVDVPDHPSSVNAVSAITIPAGGSLTLKILFDFSDKLILTSGAKQTWHVDVTDDALFVEGKPNGIVDTLATPLFICLTAKEPFSTLVNVTITIKLFLCHKEINVCLPKTVVHKIPVAVCKNELLEKTVTFELLTKL